MKNENIVITKVYSGSIAEEAGIETGDILLEINGNEVEDTIEYRYLVNDEYLEVLIRKSNGEEWELEIEKDYDEDLGIEFNDPKIENPNRCHNKCIFCFIDQLPPNMRETLYFKDDDSRLSFLQGNFITLTNMKENDIDKIINYRISPINVSVHTTNPELRIKMLNNKNAGKIMDLLKRLVDGGIEVNCQIVLCPGINDGEELVKTLNDLYSFYPKISNVAIVPVGITKFRDNVIHVNGFNKESARELIYSMKEIQSKFEKESGSVFARLGDEFYFLANEVIPQKEHYGDFEQIEDGIGMSRYFEDIISEHLSEINFDGQGMKIAFITGTLAYDFLRKVSKRIEDTMNIKISIYPITNDFFGEKITVSGLITGKDIIDRVKLPIEEELVFIPSNMLKADEDIFLDDITLNELEKSLKKKVIKCKYTGDDLISNIINEVIKCQNQ